ncbi:hypothetical protein BMY_1237 [Wohlfahrtiimonas chitiniclastica]|nr:hypothetical protein BMY_1237 [Wohlfahrtiimonas chitiniclastica]
MFRPLSLYIGLRYTRAQRKKNFISFISFISIGGIALGMMTMIVVLSVMNGFQNEVKARNLAMAYDIAITDHNPQGFVKDWENVYDAVRHEPNVIAGAPFNNGEGLLAANGQFAPSKSKGLIRFMKRKSPPSAIKSPRISSQPVTSPFYSPVNLASF